MINTIHDLILDHLERQSVLMADQVVSPSEYMANWMLDNGWQVSPEKMSIHPHILPGWVQKQSRVVMEDVAVVELVFFGRLELKKGGACHRTPPPAVPHSPEEAWSRARADYGAGHCSTVLPSRLRPYERRSLAARVRTSCCRARREAERTP
jgi:hypothetical protein